jgi:hypothetical protein
MLSLNALLQVDLYFVGSTLKFWLTHLNILTVDLWLSSAAAEIWSNVSK